LRDKNQDLEKQDFGKQGLGNQDLENLDLLNQGSKVLMKKGLESGRHKKRAAKTDSP